MLLRGVEVRGRVVDVRVRNGHVREIAAALPRDGSEVVEGHGGALLPGLHDHHVHLLALAARRVSVDCSTLTGLRSLRDADPDGGWVRGFGYHEAVAGSLDRHALDRWVPDRPVRVQHRSGALWILNTLATGLVAPALDSGPDVERDAGGNPNGRLWRYDERLRKALPAADLPDLDAVGRELTTLGLTGVTDATPDLADQAVAHLASSLGGRLRMTLLGATGALPADVRHGPFKLLLPDHALPTFPELCASIAAQHAVGRPVAVHCVTRESLLLTIAALREVGAIRGDRLEHAAVVPPEVIPELAAMDVAVVTQPSFLRLRGDDYLRDVDPDDLPCLYPFESLLRSGVRVASSSDAPYGDPDPWRSIADAQQRRSRAGTVIGADERTTAATALAGYLSDAARPGGAPREVAVGTTADLCLLHVPLTEALQEPRAEHVRMVFLNGQPVT